MMDMNATLFGQAIAFALFVWFCVKYVWPPLINAIEERQKIIAEGIANADRATKSLDLAKENVKEELEKARLEASEIIESANKSKTRILEEAKQQALVEREKIILQGKAELEAQQKLVRDELRQQVSALALAGAQKIIGRSIDQEAHKDILDQVTAQL